MKILIIRLSSIGDCVMASPVVEALRDQYPNAHMTWAVQAKSVPVVRNLPGLADVLLWDDRKGPYRTLLGALLRTWRGRFDIALDLQGLDKSALFMLASRAGRRISGTTSRKSALLCCNELVHESVEIHARERYLARAASLGIAADAADRYFPKLPISTAHRATAAEFLTKGSVERSHRLIGLNLGASIPQNRWPPERFAELAYRLIADRQTRVVVFGSAADQFLYNQFDRALDALLKSGSSMSLRGHVLNAVGHVNLLQLGALAEHCSVVVSADTGPMHIAAAAGVPVLALFGPADPRKTGPVQKPGAGTIRVLEARCVTGSWPAPMEALGVDAVHREVGLLVDENEASRLLVRL